MRGVFLLFEGVTKTTWRETVDVKMWEQLGFVVPNEDSRRHRKAGFRGRNIVLQAMKLETQTTMEHQGLDRDSGCPESPALPPKVSEVSRETIRGFPHTKRVGNYLLGRTLGEGSFAKVKEGLHTITGEKVSYFNHGDLAQHFPFPLKYLDNSTTPGTKRQRDQPQRQYLVKSIWPRSCLLGVISVYGHYKDMTT